MRPRDDVFRVEMLGLHQVALSLVEAGYEVAVPRWDAGVDVIAFRSTPRFVAHPLQIKAAAGFGFGVYRKYARYPNLIMSTFYMGMGEKFEAATKELPTGSFVVMPTKQAHFAMTKGETVVQLHGMGPWSITYVNPADDPRTKAAAKK